jgi:hypothetical protein
MAAVLILESLVGFCSRRGRRGRRIVDRIVKDGMGTCQRLRLVEIIACRTLENDKIDEETSEFRELLSDDVGNLSGIFCKGPNVCDRTEDEVDDEVDEQIEEVPVVSVVYSLMRNCTC